MTLPLIASVLISAGVLLVFIGLLSLRPTADVRQRIELYGGTAAGGNAARGTAGSTATLGEIELQESFGRRVLKPAILAVVGIFGRLTPANQLDKLRHRLTLAGDPGGLTPAQFVGIKVWTTIIMAGLVVLLLKNGQNASLVMKIMLGVWVLLGYKLPDFWLSRRITRRQMLLTNQLPDALDMLTIGVEAGLSFDQGLDEITQRWDNELSGEFRRVLYEIGVGTSRREALEHLKERTEVQDIASFVVAINHSEELGTSIGHVLAVHSQEMRIRRRQRAQEAANKVPVKMLFPLALFIFPAMFAVILGPAIPRLMRGFAAAGG